MTHPEYEVFPAKPPGPSPHHGRRAPIYPLTDELTQKGLRQIIFDALEAADSAPEYLPPKAQKALRLCGAAQALRQIHFPENEEAYRSAYERLAFDEFFFLQLAIGLKRRSLREEDARVAHRQPVAGIFDFYSSLPYVLTGGQKAAVEDILRDLSSVRPMNRLLQGDVGSGKTAVAAAALYFTVKNGFQGALMAPTDLLAQQLYCNMALFLEPHGIRVAYFAQSVTPEEKKRVGRELSEGRIDVAVGTHALLEEKLAFKDLGLAVVDEQHKFGVSQRESLRRKGGKASHFLLMTATPIPRTLAMTLYGDMDVSVIAEKPRGRGRIRSLWLAGDRRQAVHAWCASLLSEGAQAYVVCPWVDSEKTTDTKNAVRAFEEAKRAFPGVGVELVHGQMKTQEKTAAMDRFRAGEARLLVSTSLVEVGVDVPAARFMIIENAEKFGLAQLHQLRGRVGRGADESFCVALSDSEHPDTADRLQAFVETDSGFELAEKDLQHRGAGELYGRRQHGIPRFRIGDLSRDGALMEKAKNAVKALLDKDPLLGMPEHAAIRERLNGWFGPEADAR